VRLKHRVPVIAGGNSGTSMATLKFQALGARVVVLGRCRESLDEAAAGSDRMRWQCKAVFAISRTLASQGETAYFAATASRVFSRKLRSVACLPEAHVPKQARSPKNP